MNTRYFPDYFSRFSSQLNTVSLEDLTQAADLIVKTSQLGKKIIIVGNGGSAAMASHVSVDFTKNAGIRSITFNQASILTCFGNDFGYEFWVQKALEYYADPGDLVILISSSGQSKNILNGAQKALEMNLKLITLSGFRKDNPLRNFGDIRFWVDSESYNIVEMVHHVWLVALVDYIVETTH